MASDSELNDGAQAFARTLQGPAGRISFDGAVGRHLDWIAVALARGLSWNHIIELLRRAGVTRDDGRPLSRGHLSTVYSRQKRKACGKKVIAHLAAPMPAAIPQSRAAQSPLEISTPVRPTLASAPAPKTAPVPIADALEAASSPNNSAIRSFMSRAARQRNGTNER